MEEAGVWGHRTFGMVDFIHKKPLAWSRCGAVDIGHAKGFSLKNAAEILDVRVAHLAGDLVYAQIGGAQQFLCLADTQSSHVGAVVGAYLTV